MSFTRRTASIVAAGLLGFTLAGCVPQSVADGVADWSDQMVTNPDGSNDAYWEEPNRLILLLGGSSSCPTVVTKVDESTSPVTLTLERSGGPLCTADLVLAPTYFELVAGRPSQVLLKYDSEERVLEVVELESQ